MLPAATTETIVALQNEKGSYNPNGLPLLVCEIVALQNEKGSYNLCGVRM